MQTGSTAVKVIGLSLKNIVVTLLQARWAAVRSRASKEDSWANKCPYAFDRKNVGRAPVEQSFFCNLAKYILRMYFNWYTTNSRCVAENAH